MIKIKNKVGTYITMISIAVSIITLIVVLLTNTGVKNALLKISDKDYAKIELIQNIQEKVICDSPNAWIISDKDSIALFVNNRFIEIFQYSEKEIKGSDFSDFIMSPEMKEMHKEGLKKYFSSGRSDIVFNLQGNELPGIRKDGSVVPIKLFVHKTIGEDKQTYFVGEIIDRSVEDENKKASQAMIELLKDGEDMAGFGTFYWNIIDRKVEASDNYWKILNVDKSNDFSTVDIVKQIYFEDSQKVVEQVREAQEKKISYHVKYRRQQQNGEWCWIESIGKPIFDKEWNVTAYHGIVKYSKNES